MAFLIAFIAFFTLFSSVNAQQPVDPEVLRRLQEESQQQQRRESPVDTARAEGLETPEEAIMRQRLEERLQEARARRGEISNIEQEYNQRLGIPTSNFETPEQVERVLRQHGYEIFDQFQLSSASVTGRVPDSYILGVGDEIVVSLVGNQDRQVTTYVDREGRIVIPELPPVPAAGRTFAEFRADFERRVDASLIGTEVFVSLGSLKQIGVYVLGEVNFPGLLSLTSLASPLEALALSGGVKKTGSMRRIIVRNGQQEYELDLYELMQSGQGADIALTDGSSIIVPTIGDTVAIAGQVVRPGVYELHPSEENAAIGDVLTVAGGKMRTRGNEYIVGRVGNNGIQTLTTASDDSYVLESGDTLEVRYISSGQTGSVRLQGHVRNAGRWSLDTRPTLSSLLGGVENLQVNPYLLFAVLETTDPATLARILIPVNMERILSGAEDIRLKDNDSLYVLSNEDIDYLSQPAIRNTIIRNQAPAGACPSLQALADFLVDKQLDRFYSVVRSVYVTDPAEQEFNRQLEAVSGASVPDALSSGGAVAQDQRNQAADARALEGVVTLREDLPDPARLICESIYDERPDILFFTLEHSIAVQGAVRTPGVYPVAPGATLSSILSNSGGFAQTADFSNIEVLSMQVQSGGMIRAETVNVNANETSLSEVGVGPGDSVRFNSLISDQEPGTVLLAGEFGRPGVYSIRKGETLLELIERAGGLTELAYPYGAVMTRESVKREQRTSFARSAREINNALATAAIRADVEADAIAAAQELAVRLTQAEAVGRMVIEADPAVLRVQPELNITLEPGDRITMPKRANLVLVSGDVLNPGAMQYGPEKSVKDYIAEAGGLLQGADEDRIFVVYPDGRAKPVSLGGWIFGSGKETLPPGSSIIVPKNLNPFTTLDIVREVTQVFSQLAISAASIAVIARN